MTPGRLHHVGLSVADLERSIAFYRDLLGLPVRERDQMSGSEVEAVTGVVGSRVLIADLGVGASQTLELLQYVAPAGTAVHLRPFDPGHAHVGIQVADRASVFGRLSEAGVVIGTGPTTLTDAGPYWTGATVANVLDPGGITVELVQRPLR
ncbi:MAG: VOC family protein [Candidatus Dormibacter sp.]